MKIFMKLIVILVTFWGTSKTMHSIEDFIKKASLLPTFRQLYTQKKIGYKFAMNGHLDDDSFYKQYSIVSFAEFEATLDKFITVVSADLTKGKWLQNSGLEELVDPTNTKFLPYAQKLVVKPGTPVMCKGDLHGDLHSLIVCLQDLQEKNITRKDDILRICDPEFRFIFHGDYVDRGLWGVEVLYVLMLLRIKNPNVILIRGNHEDPDIANLYGFLHEFSSKFCAQSQSDLARCYKKISKLYNLLPVVMYIGTGQTKKNFAQLCHGGIEVGYNPQELLVSDNEFQMISSFTRFTQCAKLAKHTIINTQNNTRTSLITECKDFTAVTPMHPYPIGFLWHDFLVDEHAITRLSNRGMECNKSLTRDVLRAASTENAAVRMIIRAHQHIPNNEAPLMKLLLASRGCAVLWKNKESEKIFKVQDGMVITLLLSPDSLFGVPNLGRAPYNGFDYDTSIILKLAENFEDWTVQVINTNVYERLGKQIKTSP